MHATVAILTFNGERYIDELLTACVDQQLDGDYEVLVIDSGSTDATVEKVRTYPVRLVEIPNSEFGHGKTRHMAVGLSRGHYVAFLVQDATPIGREWLRRLLEPFEWNERIGCVYGRQIARPDCCIAVKQDVNRFFDGLGDPGSVRVDHRLPEAGATEPADSRTLFFSDVNSAVRRAAHDEVPFRDVPYAEDQALARDMLAAGWMKAYVADAAVRHSHDLRLREYYRRMMDEFTGLRGVGVHVRDDVVRLLRAFILTGMLNTYAALRDDDYASGTRKRQAALGPAYAAARALAIRLSRNRGS